jgi:S1-C subfamily serine protease
LWNVVCDGRQLSKEQGYGLARELALLSRRPFPQLLADIRSKSCVVAAGVRRPAVEAISVILYGKNVPFETLALATEQAKRPEARRQPRAAAVLGVIVAVAVSGALRASSSGWRPSQFLQQAVGPLSPAAPQKLPPTGSAAKVSTAAVKCENSQGSGFFVTDSMMVTNAHVVCPPGTPMYVTMADGRKLLASLKKMDSWLDLAVVEVVGAAATPLQVADAAHAQEGDKVTMVGSPFGMEFTVHSAELSFVGRNMFGVSYLQFDGTVNPGNSGGPLIDAAGHVVGVVAMKILRAERLGLAIPINYLFEGKEPMMPELRPADVDTAWAKILERTEKKDADERKEFATAFVQPGLLFAKALEHRGAGVVLMVRSSVPPADRAVRLTTRKGTETLCTQALLAGNWLSLERHSDARSGRMVQWLMKNGLASDLYVSTTIVDSPKCFDGIAGLGAEMELADGDSHANRVAVE